MFKKISLIIITLTLYSSTTFSKTNSKLDCLHKGGYFDSEHKTNISDLEKIVSLVTKEMTENEKQYWIYREKVRKEARELLAESWSINKKIDLKVLAYIRKVMGITDLASNSRAVFKKRMPTAEEQRKIKEFILKLKIQEPEDVPGIKEKQIDITKKLAGLEKMGNRLFKNFKNRNQEKSEKYREELVRNELANEYFKLNYQWSRYDILGQLTDRSATEKARDAYDAPNLEKDINKGMITLKKYVDDNPNDSESESYYGWVSGGGRTSTLNKRVPKQDRDKDEAIKYIRKASEKGNDHALARLTMVDPNKKDRLKWIIISEKNERSAKGVIPEQNIKSKNKKFNQADKRYSQTKNYDIYKRENFFRDQDLL